MSDTPRRLGMSALTHFSVCRSGRHVEIGFTDHTGVPAALQIPQECLAKLLMTLPSMIEAALRRSTGNPTLRQVYELGDWQLHLGSEPEVAHPQPGHAGWVRRVVLHVVRAGGRAGRGASSAGADAGRGAAAAGAPLAPGLFAATIFGPEP